MQQRLHFKQLFHFASRQRRKARPHLGFTLIEMVVVIGIVAGLLALILPRMGNFRSYEALRNSIEQLQSHLRVAQNNALSGTKCKENSADRANKWSLKIIDANKYQIEAECADNSLGKIFSYTLPQNINIFQVVFLDDFDNNLCAADTSALSGTVVNYQNISGSATFYNTFCAFSLANATKVAITLQRDLINASIVADKGGGIFQSTQLAAVSITPTSGSTPTPTSIPTPTAVPPTSTPTPTTILADADGDTYDSSVDCNDDPLSGGANVFQNIDNLQKDEDQDGHIVGTSGTQCVGLSSVISTRTYYKDTAGVFSWLNSASLGTDCYDKSVNAQSNQTSYFTTTRGTSALGNDFVGNSWSSFDYNCDGLEDKQYNEYTTFPAPACYTSLQSGAGGWTGGPIPDCGISASFRRCAQYTAQTNCTSTSCTSDACYSNCAGVSVLSWRMTDVSRYQRCR